MSDEWTPTSSGEVYKDGESIAVVNYSLRVEQEILIVESISDTNEIPGLKIVTGQINVITGERDLMDGNLILYLSDGRQWEFFTTNGNPITGGYSAVNTSGEGLKKVD